MGVILRRDSDDSGSSGLGLGPSIIVLVAILVFALCSTGFLVYLRRMRRNVAAARAAGLPIHIRHGHHRTLTISTAPAGIRRSVFVYDEKMDLMANSTSPPPSPIPEIHVTFPDEKGESGETKAGRVVVLHISDTGRVGMEPLHQEQLPPYQRDDAARFQSLDIERIGGLKEKPSENGPRYS